MWGMNRSTLEDNLKAIKDAGFEGVEMIVPGDSNNFPQTVKQREGRRFAELLPIHFIVKPSFKASISRPISSALGALGFSFRYVR